MTLLTTRLKLSGILGDRAFYDTARGHLLTIPTGAGLRLQVGLFKPDGTVDSTTGLATLSLEIYETRLDAALYLPAVSTASFSALTAETWADGSAQHASITLTSEQTNKLLTTGLKQCWAVVYGTDGDGERIDFAAGPILLVRTNAGGTGPEGDIDPLYPTLAQLVALLAAKADLGEDGKVPTAQLPAATGGVWGSITGALTDQTDLQSALSAKAAAATSVTLNGVETLTNKTLTEPTVTGVLTHSATDTVPTIAMPNGSTWRAKIGNLTIISANTDVFAIASNGSILGIGTSAVNPTCFIKGASGLLEVFTSAAASTYGDFKAETITSPATGTGAPSFKTANGFGFGQDHLNKGMTIGSAAGAAFWIRSTSLVSLGQPAILGWSGGGGWSGAVEVGLGRNDSGVLEVNGGTLGQFRDLKVRNLIAFGAIILGDFTVATVPDAATNYPGVIFVNDETNSPQPAYSDGTGWKTFGNNGYIEGP